MTLEDMIAACIAAKTGNREFVLHYDEEEDRTGGTWSAGIGNDCPFVALGEASPEISADGSTPIEAVRALMVLLGQSMITPIKILKFQQVEAGQTLHLTTSDELAADLLTSGAEWVALDKEGVEVGRAPLGEPILAPRRALVTEVRVERKAA